MTSVETIGKHDSFNPEVFRRNVSLLFDTKLNDICYCVNLERAIYNYSLKEATRMKLIKQWSNESFMNLYINRTRSIYSNLTDDLIITIKTQFMTYKQLAEATHHELQPLKWEKQLERKTKRNNNMFEDNMSSATDAFTCRKCKQSKCSYYQLQTRSADEPMTTFITCIPCGHRWRN